MDELLQAGQALDPLREMQFDMPGNIGGLGLINGSPLGYIGAECVRLRSRMFPGVMRIGYSNGRIG